MLQARSQAGRSGPIVLAVASGVTWRTAEEVPGTATLNVGGFAKVISVSCGLAGNCAAGGFYAGRFGHEPAFVVNEANGIWRAAREIPGTANLYAGGAAEVFSVSCASAGNCSAGGQYTDSSGHGQAFVVNEASGTWRTARQVPGTATLNTGGKAGVVSVSRASADRCSAGGEFTGSSGHNQAFTVNETSGTWRTAEEVPGTAILNAGGGAVVFSVSCASANNCAAGGFYTDKDGHERAFVVNRS